MKRIHIIFFTIFGNIINYVIIMCLNSMGARRTIILASLKKALGFVLGPSRIGALYPGPGEGWERKKEKEARSQAGPLSRVYLLTGISTACGARGW